MRELTVDELQQVGGGVRIADATAFGTGAGSAFGIIVTNTARGGAMGGAAGAGLGFAFGVGYAVGTLIYERIR